MFSRERKLPFRTVLQLVLRKSVKSLQLVLNEWCDTLEQHISASAYSQARQKLQHTAFIELHQKSILDVIYGDDEYERYKGHRLLALDGSALKVPKTEETQAYFGVIKYLNGRKTRAINHVEAKMTVLYDVLNSIVVSAKLARARTSDLKASHAQLAQLKRGDIVIADRGFESYMFFAEILANGADFIVRCKNTSYTRYHHLDCSNCSDTTVVVQPNAYIEQETYGKQMTIRFLKIVLGNGETEILATSLLDTKIYPAEDFRELYRKRWQVETLFFTLKSRLAIDNFTGKSVESILQDFYSTIFVSSLETILTADANKQLHQKNTLNQLKVNKAVSFNVIKNTVIKLLFEQPPNFEEQISRLFMLNPVSIRPARFKAPRVNRTDYAVNSLNFQRAAKKHVF